MSLELHKDNNEYQIDLKLNKHKKKLQWKCNELSNFIILDIYIECEKHLFLFLQRK